MAAIYGADDVTDASYYDLDDNEVAHLVTSERETVTTGKLPSYLGPMALEEAT